MSVSGIVPSLSRLCGVGFQVFKLQDLFTVVGPTEIGRARAKFILWDIQNNTPCF